VKNKIVNIIRKLASFKKKKWKNDGRRKILIMVNPYFTKRKWEQLIEKKYPEQSKSWDLVFLKSKTDISNHYEDADVCFLHGLSILYKSENKKPKFLYFPLIGLEFLENKKIPKNYRIEKPPVFSSRAIAEYCLAQTILISRKLQNASRDQNERVWEQKEILKNTFIPLAQLKIGILGIGNIGLAIADIFKANGCEVTGCDKVVRKEENKIDKWYDINELPVFLEHIDVLVIGLPLNSETRGLIGEKELKQLGPSGYLVNVSRGAIVKEAELVMALEKNIISGAVLDVFENEPLMPDNKLYNLPNVIITPHVAGNINYFIDEIQTDFINKLNAV
jgi:phosphoglycerate dehydrogenase-like enzyme